VLVERLNLPAGQDVEFKDVLLLAEGGKVTIGRPVVDGAVVKGVVEGEERGIKLFPLKKKRRKNYRRRIGHRQIAAVVRIKEITAG
jgi:large subunit ribosomal protein L21